MLKFVVKALIIISIPLALAGVGFLWWAHSVLRALNGTGQPDVYGAYRRVVAEELSQVAMQGSTPERFSSLTEESSEPYSFWGRILRLPEPVCLVSWESAQGKIRLRHPDPGSIPPPVTYAGRACGDFVLVNPPSVPAKIAQLEPANEPIKLLCVPDNDRTHPYKMDYSAPANGSTRIATVVQGNTAQELLDSLYKKANSDETITVKHPSAKHLSDEPMTLRELLAETDILPGETIVCDGFDIHHFTFFAKTWPLGSED